MYNIIVWIIAFDLSTQTINYLEFFWPFLPLKSLRYLTLQENASMWEQKGEQFSRGGPRSCLTTSSKVAAETLL